MGEYDKKFINIYQKSIRKALYAGMILFHILFYAITPPKKYPYIRELFFALLGFAYFALIYVYVHCKMVYGYIKDKGLEEEFEKVHNGDSD